MLKQNPVVLLIRGSIENPADEDSKSLVQKVRDLHCEFTAVDVTSKPEIQKVFKED